MYFILLTLHVTPSKPRDGSRRRGCCPRRLPGATQVTVLRSAGACHAAVTHPMDMASAGMKRLLRKVVTVLYLQQLLGTVTAKKQHTCASQMQTLCGNARYTSTGNCLVCVGQQQHQLRASGCSEPMLEAFCDGNAVVTSTVNLIRHGEKAGAADPNGLSARGYQRAACLADHFGNRSTYQISHLFAYTDKKSHRSVDTITPLAHSLNLDIDTRVKRDDISGLVAYIASLPAESVALICWEHKVLSEQAEALGVHSPPVYPLASRKDGGCTTGQPASLPCR